MCNNSSWNFKSTDFEDVFLIEPFCALDNRGYFLKDFNSDLFEKNDIDFIVKESFYSFSKKNVLRGLHFQRERQMSKLVRCMSGKILDVVCDLRKDSPTFMKHQKFILSADNMNALFIPGGFAHGFLALEDAVVSYKCGEVFVSEYDDGILWCDKTLSIDWGVDDISKIVISEKDKNLQSFEEFRGKYGSLN